MSERRCLVSHKVYIEHENRKRRIFSSFPPFFDDKKKLLFSGVKLTFKFVFLKKKSVYKQEKIYLKTLSLNSHHHKAMS